MRDISPGEWGESKNCTAALDRPPEMRSAFLAEACRDDTVLLDEVGSLLASDASAAASGTAAGEASKSCRTCA